MVLVMKGKTDGERDSKKTPNEGDTYDGQNDAVLALGADAADE